MKRHPAISAAAALLLLTASAPRVLGAPITAYATVEPVRLGGRSLAEPGDAFYNGRTFAPVTIVYGGHVYAAVKYVAALYHLSVTWRPRQREVVMGSGPPVLVPSTRLMRHPSFSGYYRMQVRYLGLSVRGRAYTPNGKVVRFGATVLPDALYTTRTMYMPLTLLGRAIGASVVWPKGQTGPTAKGGFSVQIAAPIRRLVAGSVLSVQAAVSGAPRNDPLAYVWRLDAPGGLQVPLLGGMSSQSEALTLPASSPTGTYRLTVTVRDTRTGSRVSTTTLLTVTRSTSGPGAPTFGFDPQTIARAYGISNVWLSGNLGQGQEIFLYEQQGFNMGDISTFDSVFGLPAPEVSVRTAASGPLAAGLEATMDVEWVHALAPLARIVVIEDSSTDPGSFPGILSQSLQTAWFNGSEIAAVAYGVPVDAGADSAASSTIGALEGQGFSVFASSGDSLVDSPGASLVWPGTDPNVISVGGTSLFERNPAFFFETYWEGTYGTSAYGTTQAPAPYWQRAVTGGTRRSVPDVAFDANLRTGVAVYLNGNWWVGGGTSLGAPAWAAVWALCRDGAQNLPAAPVALYAVAQSSYGEFALRNPAHTEFDARTGLGTPNVGELIYALQHLY